MENLIQGRQIFDKQKSAGRLIKISYRNLIKSWPRKKAMRYS